MKITRQQYADLCDAKMFDSISSFQELLKELTGIEAKPYTGYCYYDNSDNYIGDSNDTSVLDLLHNAYIEVED